MGWHNRCVAGVPLEAASLQSWPTPQNAATAADASATALVNTPCMTCAASLSAIESFVACGKLTSGSEWTNGADGACGTLPWQQGLERTRRGARERGRVASQRCMRPCPSDQFFRRASGAGHLFADDCCVHLVVARPLEISEHGAAASERPPSAIHHTALRCT